MTTDHLCTLAGTVNNHSCESIWVTDMLVNKHLDEGVITFVTSNLCHLVIIGIVISVSTVIVALKLVMLWTWLWMWPLVVTRIPRVVRWIENWRGKDVIEVSVLIVSTD